VVPHDFAATGGTIAVSLGADAVGSGDLQCVYFDGSAIAPAGKAQLGRDGGAIVTCAAPTEQQISNAMHGDVLRTTATGGIVLRADGSVSIRVAVVPASEGNYTSSSITGTYDFVAD